VARGELVPLLPDWTLPEGDISLVHAPGPPPRVRTLADFLRDRLASK
jgi:DNA-binding transcriptional LysR family regulator